MSDSDLLKALLTPQLKIAKYAPFAGYGVAGLGLSIILNLLPPFGLISLYFGLTVLGAVILGLVIGLNEIKPNSSSVPTVVCLIIVAIFCLGFMIVAF